MIEITGLTKRYRDLVAVNDISFSVPKGEIVGFLGPNGAGKSTTMKMLTGFLPASSGRAKVAGFDVFEEPMAVKRAIGYLPEIPPVYPDLTVREYLRFVGKLKGLRGEELERNVERSIARVSLGDVSDRLIRNISKGYQQRTGLGQALLGSPSVLILDEPTSGLDYLRQNKIINLLRKLSKSNTIIIITHSEFVSNSCDFQIKFNNGKIKEIVNNN